MQKLGLEGFKELKVELMRAASRADSAPEVDINFPFDATSSAQEISERMARLYETTLSETREILDPAQLDYAAKLVLRADTVDIYTGSHNLYPAGMFRDRLLSAGKSSTCYDNIEAQVRTALASGPDHTAIVISYSGLAPTSRRSCRSLAVGMSRSSSSARHTVPAFTPALPPISPWAISRA